MLRWHHLIPAETSYLLLCEQSSLCLTHGARWGPLFYPFPLAFISRQFGLASLSLDLP